MDSQEKKNFIENIFNTVSEGYDNAALRFFQHSAEKISPLLSLNGDEHILDAATGTGRAALCIAEHLPNGKVVGVDMSRGMLDQAVEKAKRLQRELDFQLMDIENLRFSDNSFDHANCSFGLFFIDDMAAALTELASKVKPGGKVVSCCFTEASFQPYVELFNKRIESYGVEIPEAGFKRLATEDKSKALYQDCGLTNVTTHCYQVGYQLADAKQWWNVIWYAGFRGLVDQIDASRVVEFKQKHLSEVQVLATERGLDFSVEVIFTVGEV